MIQPGKETNLPNNSGTVGLQGWLGQSIYQVDGFSLTIGIVVVVILGFIALQMMSGGKRRR